MGWPGIDMVEGEQLGLWDKGLNDTWQGYTESPQPFEEGDLIVAVNNGQMMYAVVPPDGGEVSWIAGVAR